MVIPMVNEIEFRLWIATGRNTTDVSTFKSNKNLIVLTTLRRHCYHHDHGQTDSWRRVLHSYRMQDRPPRHGHVRILTLATIGTTQRHDGDGDGDGEGVILFQ